MDKGLWPSAVLFLLFAVIVFYGILSGFGKMLFEGSEKRKKAATGEKGMAAADDASVSNMLGIGIMILLAICVITLGISIPDFVDHAIRNCISVIGLK